MPKYNFPPDLLDEMKALRQRIGRLERSIRSAPIPIHAHKSPTGATGSFVDPVVVNSGTFADTHNFSAIFLAPVPIVVLWATCSDGSTAGEFRLTLAGGAAIFGPNGESITPTAIPIGTTVESTFTNRDQSPNYWLQDDVGADYYVKLQVRRTAGAGTISIRGRYLVQVPG